MDSSRAWMYQCCTEYGWWQTFSDVHTLRSKKVDINFYRQFCKDAFGVALWPDVDRKNTEYGALNLKAFNLLMNNGDEGTSFLMKTLGNGQVCCSPRATSSQEWPTAPIAHTASISTLLHSTMQSNSRRSETSSISQFQAGLRSTGATRPSYSRLRTCLKNDQI